jgi:hypothetical protein
MKVKRTKTVIEVTQKELEALKIVTNLLDDLAGEEDISNSFDEMRDYSYYSLSELTEGLREVIDFLDSEKQEDFTINIVNEEEN